jgi:predicted metalloprotease
MRIKVMATGGLLTWLAAFMLIVWTGVSSAETEVTPNDIQTVKTKLHSANPYFREVWSQVFADRGLSFQPPAIMAFSSTINTACGSIKPGNGIACLKDNTIYLDAGFLAQLMNETAEHNKTDGDYAAIVVAAHEFGHQVARQLGSTSPNSFYEEQQADCLAGAITRQARIDGYLDPGDLEEARYALAISGDMNFITVGTDFKDIYTPDSHGSASQRVDAFDRGYYVGPRSCTDKLGTPGVPPAGGVIASNYIAQTTAGAGQLCEWSPTLSGLTVSSKSQSNVCELRFGGGMFLPADFRVELAARPLRGRADQCYGLLLGQLDYRQPAIEHFVFCVSPKGYSRLGTRSASSSSELGPEPLSDPFSTESLHEASVSLGLEAGPVAAWNVEKHLIIDVHRTESGTVVLGYVDGRFMEIGTSLQAAQGPVGVYVGASMEVLVTGLRVLRLPH